MKSLNQYITEKIKDLPSHVKGIIVFDIDDTLLRVDPDEMHVWKKNPDTGREIPLTTAQLMHQILQRKICFHIENSMTL